MNDDRVSLPDTLDRVRHWFVGHFDELSALSAELTAELHLDERGLLSMTEAERRRMKAISVSFLAEHAVVDGCGLIFAHSALGTEDGRLEWWVREDESRFARYSFGVVPGADRYYDYEQHEWFLRAFFEGARAAVGPYIDYLGVESYVVTLTAPAEVSGQRVGAVGNDIQLGDLEATLIPILSACDHDVVILNRHGNVLVSNTAKYLPGELISGQPEGTELSVLDPQLDSLRLLYSLERVS
jgi:hypothetical protein